MLHSLQDCYTLHKMVFEASCIQLALMQTCALVVLVWEQGSHAIRQSLTVFVFAYLCHPNFYVYDNFIFTALLSL